MMCPAASQKGYSPLLSRREKNLGIVPERIFKKRNPSYLISDISSVFHSLLKYISTSMKMTTYLFNEVRNFI
uniref:Putative ovule protein n=1 Tax=Solanum chacoense TaxID=4108 RepID=A0A0V0I7J0_SOLCH